MTGCFGNSDEDRFHESELNRHLDSHYNDDEDDEYPSLQEDTDMEDYYDKEYPVGNIQVERNSNTDDKH